MTASKYLFLSGGSGVTPMMAMTRSAFDHALIADIEFVHAARSPADIIFRDELEYMGRRNHSIKPTFICEGDSKFERWPGFRGRLDRQKLELICPDYAERMVFVCGPAPFMKAAKELFENAGFDMSRYHQESFNFDSFTDEAQEEILEATDIIETPLKIFQIEFTKTNRVVECPENLTVMEAARRAGIRVPSSCSKGLCGTCKSTVKSGTLDMQHSGGIRQREIDKGLALLCCSKPTSDMVIER